MEKILAGIFGTKFFAATGIRRKLMNKQGLKNTSTNTAIEILKTYPEFRFYHEYIEKRLAGDFAFDLVNLLLKNRKENNQLKSNLEACQSSLKEHMQELVKCEKCCQNCKYYMHYKHYYNECKQCEKRDEWELREAIDVWKM